MIRTNAAWLIGISESIDALDGLEAGQTVLDAIRALFGAQNALEQIFDQSLYRDHVRACRAAGRSLHEQISGLLSDANWAERKLEQYEVAGLKNSKAIFKTVFMADLSILPLYIIAPKDTYDVSLLIEAGIKLFPASIMDKAPEVEKDAREVGRALAYELATACGFHTFRVTESLVRRYWDSVSEGRVRPKLQTLGNFAAEMEKHKVGDARVVEAIKQMTKLHRNPLIHPEVILTVEEAIGIIGMARSVIGPMLQVLPDAPTTTGAAPLDFSSFGELVADYTGGDLSES